MSRKTWLTKSGVLVFSKGRLFERRARKPGWKIFAYRVDTGGRAGLLWLRNLREARR